jgi:CRISPR/Cas system CSM-associated protein Csm3 (group 7 of RAMP superfamily)
MARELKSRLLITGTLVTRTPIHVGAYGDSLESDLPLARDGKNRFYVPGTSLAGVVREWTHRNLPEAEDTLSILFGSEKRDREVDTKHAASLWIFEDMPVEGALMEIRDGVSIDRTFGTAIDQRKFDRAVLPRGTRLPLCMTLELTAGCAPAAKQIAAYVIEALEAGRIPLGASKTRGLGRVTLKDCRIIEQTLNTREGILQALSGGGEARSLNELREDKSPLKTLEEANVEISVEWAPLQPVIVKSGHDGIGVDSLPLVSYKDGGRVSLVIPGSSLKGALRSHAERIVRTLITESSDAQDPMSLPLIRDLFGCANASVKKSRGSEESKLQPAGRIGALSVADCYSHAVVDGTLWEKVEIATADDDKPLESRELHGLVEVLKQSAGLDFKHAYHVAIDRWTGGAAEQALFSVLAPRNITWERIRLAIDLSRMNADLRECALALLLLVLRDLAESRIPIGFAVNRGFGEIAVRKIHVDRCALHGVAEGQEEDFKELVEALPATPMPPGSRDLLQRLDEAWKRWIAAEGGRA